MMEFEYWWLLAFPLFFGLGWVAARIDIRQLLTETRHLPLSYFKGLNFLVNEQPDKAIEAFVEIAEVNAETVELQFALGKLFRRRGEIERAIRLHQSLFDLDSLSEEQKLAALYELGVDYHKAGLLDRAEDVFSRLQQTSYAEPAARYLLEIYIQEKDWLKAVDTARVAGKLAGTPMRQEIAQFHCEQAQALMAAADYEAARAQLREALRANRRCVRAMILLGDLEQQQGQTAQAITEWKRVESQDASYLSLVAGRLVDAYRQLGDVPQAITLLRTYLDRHASLDLLDAAFTLVLAEEGPHAAYLLVRDELRRHPSLFGLDRLLEAQLLESRVERRQDTQLIKALVHGHTQRLTVYRCEHCGFNARMFHWQCPACGAWESIPPKRIEEVNQEPVRLMKANPDM